MTSVDAADGSNKYLIILDNPPHLYHGNHWFHFCEHFVSRSNEFRDLLSSLRDDAELYLFSNNQKLLNFMTSFTFFLLVLTFWHPKVRSISVIRVHQQYLKSSFFDYEDWKIGEQRTILGSQTLFQYNPAFHIYQRFKFPNEGIESSQPVQEWSGKYLGSIGEYPITSYDWFQSSDDVSFIRKKIVHICDGSQIFEKEAQEDRFPNPNKRRLIIYQRDETRRFLDFEWLVQKIQEILIYEWEVIQVVHKDERNPCFLYEIMKRSHAFLSLHGFQFTAMMFLPPKSLIIEIFPYKYFKQSYFPLAQAYGHSHLWFQSKYVTSRLLSYVSLEVCMKDQTCRSYARNQDVRLSWTEVNAIVNTLWVTYVQETAIAANSSRTSEQVLIEASGESFVRS